MSGQAIVWFGIAGGAAVFATSLLYQRYIRRTPQAVRSRGSFTLFAILMYLFATFAALVGLITVDVGG